MLFAEPSMMLLIALPAALLLCMAIIGGIIALLVNRRTRLPTAILLVAAVVSIPFVLYFAWVTVGLQPATRSVWTPTPDTIRMRAEAKRLQPARQVTARSDTGSRSTIAASNPPNAMAAKAKPIVEKTEQQQAQEAAERAAVVVRATLSALGRAMIDPERTLAESKATKQGRPHPKGEGTKVAPKRPEWIDAPPHVVSLGGPLSDVYQMSVNVGPYTSRAECDEKLPEELQKAVGRYGQLCLGEAAGPVRLPQDVLRQVVKAQWEETRPYSVGPMTHLHVLLQFDHQVKERLLDEHRRVVVAGRLAKLGGCVAAGLMLMTVALGYLKIDLATGGAYRRRLRLAAAVGILAVVAVAIAVIA